MGACLRSKETLALFLAPFFWKKLSGENISWKNDFITVDSAQVTHFESIFFKSYFLKLFVSLTDLGKTDRHS